MTVKELIKQLKAYNPDREIFVTLGESEHGWIFFHIDVALVKYVYETNSQGREMKSPVIAILPQLPRDAAIPEVTPPSTNTPEPDSETVSPEPEDE